MYSSAVFDLDAGPVTITLPDAGKRFRSMQVINEDHYVPEVSYESGPHVLDKAKVGTRYAVVGIRTLVDPANPEDVKQVHALQDAIKVDQPGGPGKFEVPQWDAASQKKVRDALLVLGSTIPDFKGAFGKKGEVDPVRHLIGSAAAWGGNPDRDAIYLNVTPAKNDGKTIYKLTAKDVPVDGFWSISLYNAEGYYQKNPQNAYTLNNITAKKSDDGSITIQFGGCDGQTPNCLPIMPGWNYMVRLYRPRAEILDGKWKFPEAATNKGELNANCRYQDESCLIRLSLVLVLVAVERECERCSDHGRDAGTKDRVLAIDVLLIPDADDDAKVDRRERSPSRELSARLHTRIRPSGAYHARACVRARE